MHTEDDKDLLMAMHKGHEAPARLLWGRLSPGLCAYARALLRGNAALADDAVQNAMLRVLALSAARVREVRDVRAFLLAVTRREAAALMRSARRESVRVAAGGGPGGARGAPPQARGEVGAAVDALPRRLREPVVLRHVVGLTFDQMALATGIHRSTLASRYQCAMEHLRGVLNEVGWGGEDGGREHGPAASEQHVRTGAAMGPRQETGHV
jgi:DNA-directed RNA polymerase specialized sigma24 family protein